MRATTGTGLTVYLRENREKTLPLLLNAGVTEAVVLELPMAESHPVVREGVL